MLAGILSAAGSVLIALNSRTTRNLWRSHKYDRPQKIAQTALVWVVPGAFILVDYVMADRQTPWSGGDTTSDVAVRFDADDGPIAPSHGDGGHDGSF